jgi:hypothetical protein
VPWLTVSPNGFGGFFPDRGRPAGAVLHPGETAPTTDGFGRPGTRARRDDEETAFKA